MNDYFATARETAMAATVRLKRHSQQMQTIRLLLFFSAIFALAAGYDQSSPALISLGIVLLFLFSLILHHHTRLRQELLFLSNRLAVLQACGARKNEAWRHFPINGQAYLTDDLPQGIDLSLFGKDSIYQFLCAARTRLGRDALAAALCPHPDRAHIQLASKRQGAVKEFISRPQLATDLMAQLNRLPDGHDTTDLLRTLQDSRLSAPSALMQRLRWLPLVSFLALGLMLGGLLPPLIPAAFFFLQFALSGFLAGPATSALAPIGQMHQSLLPYHDIFAKLESMTCSHSYLRELQQSLQDPSAAAALHRLSIISDLAHMRQNLVFAFLMDTLFLWDCHFAVWFARWRQKNTDQLNSWLHQLAEIEVLLSLSTIGWARQEWCLPQLMADAPQPTLKADSLKHLLLAEDKAVANTADLRDSTTIITGSNMSGKTTWLRTLASSCILAYAGAPVCAKSLQVSPLAIFTSIRVNDDIAHGISTFYAELLRIRQMVDFAKKKQPMLLVIDEIFKGTNSADRIVGAREALRRLTLPWSITLVSTHDFELCRLEQENTADVPVTNCHFAEHYEDDKILFDYKLKPGRCQTTNARCLLKMAGIIDG